VLVRQKGWVYEPGNNVFSGKDYTIHAQTEGVVQFRKKKITRFDGRVYLKTFVDVLTS
jgi:large subunit ribosomal protein L27